MADQQLRPDVVAALTEPAALPADLVAQVLDASDTERAAAAVELADRTRVFLEQAGVLRPSASVLDLGISQVEALAAAYGLVRPWWAGRGWNTRTLGGILKVVPADIAAAVTTCFSWAGSSHPNRRLRRSRPGVNVTPNRHRADGGSKAAKGPAWTAKP